MLILNKEYRGIKLKINCDHPDCVRNGIPNKRRSCYIEIELEDWVHELNVKIISRSYPCYVIFPKKYNGDLATALPIRVRKVMLFGSECKELVDAF